MPLEAKITQNYNNGFIQLQTKEPSGYTRYYKVPNRAVKPFSKEIKQQNKDLNKLSNIAYFLAIFIGCLGASFFTKNIDGFFKKFLAQLAGGVGLAMITSIGVNEYTKSKENQLMNKYKVKEQHYIT